MLYCGDNLEIMRGMDDGCIDLIATDPPFNTGKDWGQFNDKWENGLKGYLKFMEPRLAEMHRLLKDTGSIYLHCDSHASHYLKVMMDGIFGMKHFRNEIVWTYRRWAVQNTDYQRMHDIILRYTKGNETTWNQLYEPLPDTTQRRWGNKKQKSDFSTGKRRSISTEDKSLGVAMRDVWEISLINSQSKELLHYPTQKPVALLERIIKASSNQDDVVLDPFCGSGTTLRAAKTLGRKYIGIDQNPEAIRISENRLNPPQQELFTA